MLDPLPFKSESSPTNPFPFTVVVLTSTTRQSLVRNPLLSQGSFLSNWKVPYRP